MLCCPQCGSKLLYKDGYRYLADGSSVQRYLCRNCSYRFSETRKPYNGSATKSECDAHQKAAKLLVEVQKQTEKQEAGATEKAEIKGKIVEFLWHLRKEGYSKKTIEVYGKRLSQLAKSCNILDPEEVKEFIAERETWNNATKLLTVEVYKAFTNFLGIPFKAPRYQQQVKIPFIPLEQEIDALIAGCSRKIATILQLLKETGMRIGEAKSLEWTDIDLERGIITLNSPEKNSKPRMFKISARLVGMLNTLSKPAKDLLKEIW